MEIERLETIDVAFGGEPIPRSMWKPTTEGAILEFKVHNCRSFKEEAALSSSFPIHSDVGGDSGGDDDDGGDDGDGYGVGVGVVSSYSDIIID